MRSRHTFQFGFNNIPNNNNNVKMNKGNNLEPMRNKSTLFFSITEFVNKNNNKATKIYI